MALGVEGEGDDTEETTSKALRRIQRTTRRRR
jgi:hypothetical protein